MAIGVFDSGIGGLTVLERLVAALPNQRFVYLGDNANAPYGDRAPDDVIRLTRAGVETLFDEGCGLILLACNTASALALHPLQQDWLPTLPGPERRILGVFVPIVETITGRRWSGSTLAPAEAPIGRRRVFFFATPATVRSGAFAREVADRSIGVAVVSQACPGLVAALEAGEAAVAERLATEAVAAAASQSGAAAATPEAAILGCTHFPLAEAAFRRALPAETALLSQPDLTAASLARYLERHSWFEETGPGAVRFLTSGDVDAVSAIASRFWRGPTARPIRFERV